MQLDKEDYKEQFHKFIEEGLIKESSQSFKISQFLKKAEASFLIANDLEKPRPEPEKLYWDLWAITVHYYAMLYAAKAAILSKGYEVSSHDAAQAALAHLFVPDKLEEEALTILDQAHRIFEDEYVQYFEEAKRESRIARYRARPAYTQRRLEEIHEYARKFLEKINQVLA